VSNSWIELAIDRQRNVGALDPYLREEHIGMGCALENLMLAAIANGYAATVTLAPGKLAPISVRQSEPELVARIDLAAGKREESELYDAIPRRHTNRGAYRPERSIPPQFADALSRLPSDEADVKVFLFTADRDRHKIVEMSSAANAELYSDPEVRRDSERWIRTSWSSVQEFKDGLTIDTFGLSPIATAVSKMMPSRMLRWVASREETKRYSELMLSAPLIGMIAVRDRYDREQCLRAGRVWQRAHLLATARGLAGRPCNEAVEMVDHERVLAKQPSRAVQLGEIIGDAAWQPTFIFYMGYPMRSARASPRRPVENVVL
jgi:nitroreductase